MIVAIQVMLALLGGIVWYRAAQTYQDVRKILRATIYVEEEGKRLINDMARSRLLTTDEDAWHKFTYEYDGVFRGLMFSARYMMDVKKK